MIKLPNDKICYNLPEQVGVNVENIQYLAETYKNLDEEVATWPTYKAEWDQFEIDYANWTTTLSGYLTSMSSAAVSAIAGQTIAPANVAATTSISAPSITGDNIVENMSGYSFQALGSTGYSLEFVYVGAVKTGNKLTVAVALNITKTDDGTAASNLSIGYLLMPADVLSKLYPTDVDGGLFLSLQKLQAFSSNGNAVTINGAISKSATSIAFASKGIKGILVEGTKYYVRIEATFLLSDNLAA